jgi:hypothetical protein
VELFIRHPFLFGRRSRSNLTTTAAHISSRIVTNGYSSHPRQFDFEKMKQENNNNVDTSRIMSYNYAGSAFLRTFIRYGWHIDVICTIEEVVACRCFEMTIDSKSIECQPIKRVCIYNRAILPYNLEICLSEIRWNGHVTVLHLSPNFQILRHQLPCLPRGELFPGKG